jgi:hypothetical protein
MSILNCVYQEYYCTDDVIDIDSVLYSSLTPLRTVNEGYYGDLNSTPKKIYQINSNGQVINILSENQSGCINITPPEPKYYYKANKYACGVSCEDSQEVVYLSCSGVLRLNCFYTETYQEDFPIYTYQVTEILGRNQPLLGTIIEIEFNSFVGGLQQTSCTEICNISPSIPEI